MRICPHLHITTLYCYILIPEGISILCNIAIFVEYYQIVIILPTALNHLSHLKLHYQIHSAVSRAWGTASLRSTHAPLLVFKDSGS